MCFVFVLQKSFRKCTTTHREKKNDSIKMSAVYPKHPKHPKHFPKKAQKAAAQKINNVFYSMARQQQKSIRTHRTPDTHI